MIRFLTLLLIFITTFSAADGLAPVHSTNTAIIAMCRPMKSQIKNIEDLYEKDLLPLDKMTLVGIYHEDELSNYEPAHDYVKENSLTWVRFEIIRGKVAENKLFVSNAWTTQFKKIFASVDAIIFTGGSDIPPRIYGEENNLLTSAMTPNRSMYEVSFQFHLLGGKRNLKFQPFLQQRPHFPIVGICLGCQTMNVATGGSLYQDIPSQIYNLQTIEQLLQLGQDRIHSARYLKKMYPAQQHFPPAFHRIRLLADSKFVTEMGLDAFDTPWVLTSHHQCIKDLGTNISIAATSMDGKVVEAIEHRKFPNVLGVQFHPEYQLLYQKHAYFCSKPKGERDFNARLFLKENPPSLKLHRNIWRWLANKAVSEKK